MGEDGAHLSGYRIDPGVILASRPLRFLGAVAIGWTTLRVILLWPQPVTSSPARTSLSLPGVEIGIPFAALLDNPKGPMPVRVDVAKQTTSAEVFARPSQRVADRMSGRSQAVRRPDPISVALALAALVRFAQEESVGAAPMATAPQEANATASRWSGSAWMIARPAGPAIPFAGQLGGSQAGARIAYLLDPRHRVAIVGRIAGALTARATQAAIGVEWQPTRAPVRLFAERRVAVDGGRGGSAAGVVGGLGPVALPRAFAIEGYGQAGVIARDGGEGFADGAVHVARPVADLGWSRIEAGLGAWGGAQRGVRRLDLGPSVAAILPIADQRVRLTVDWRQRVAGNARPNSGVALTLGADF